ncbi:MAG: DUF4476 domain-containing protein [Flavobacteriales bacterium]|nr:DUF4476 domain-containing protein [Flavobacteriales bacterium]
MKTVFTLLMILAGFVAQARTQFGYAEFFLMVNQPGIFTVRIDDQVITNSNGKFRFFDLRPGVKEVFVQRNGVNLFRSMLSIYNGSRTVAEFRSNQGIVIIQQVQLMQNNQMNQDFWYGYWNYNPNTNQWNNNNNNQWNNNWNNNNNQWNNNNNQWNNQMMGMDQNTFNMFKETVRKQSFDSNKVPMIKNQARTANFTSAQVAELLGLMSFDSYKLDVAKFCYDFVIDKQNYFVTFGQFQFDSYSRDLSNYIATRN